jgi:putative membrane protein
LRLEEEPIAVALFRCEDDGVADSNLLEGSMEERTMTGPIEAKFTGPKGSTNLAAERTRLAYERTLMAWLRTSTSLITFGFTIQKFFQIESDGRGHYDGFLGPSNVGRLMILIGMLILVVATVEHRADMKLLRKDYPFIRRSRTTVFAAVIAVLGVLAMASAFIRR